MHRMILLTGVPLAACAAAAPQLPVHGGGGGYVCRQQAFEEFIGQAATSEVGARLLGASGARVVRWVQPGMMVTMDYRQDRLTVRLDSGNRIVTARCG